MSDKKEGSPLKKFFAMGSGPTLETFPELVDIVVWSRFVLAIIYGGMLARGNQSGAKVLLFALNFVAFMPMLYCSTFLSADMESYGGKLLWSGTINSLALIMLIWVYFYTLSHEEEEKMLASALTQVFTSSMTATDTVADEVVITPDAPVMEESEF